MTQPKVFTTLGSHSRALFFIVKETLNLQSFESIATKTFVISKNWKRGLPNCYGQEYWLGHESCNFFLILAHRAY